MFNIPPVSFQNVCESISKMLHFNQLQKSYCSIACLRILPNRSEIPKIKKRRTRKGKQALFCCRRPFFSKIEISDQSKKPQKRQKAVQKKNKTTLTTTTFSLFPRPPCPYSDISRQEDEAPQKNFSSSRLHSPPLLLRFPTFAARVLIGLFF